MRSIIRLAAAGAVALPLLIGAAGVASADVEYDHESAVAGPNGAGLHIVHSGADESGNAYFYELWMGAGPDGAGVAETGAWVYGDHAGWFGNYSGASTDGAFHSSSSATADDDSWHEDDD